ncbi:MULTISPECIES: hypothetical protein [Vibrio]|uniref:hypothetical protein n=1 Tax=Vibrio TaxID=662 RepID=UPI0025797E52|nr:hypothetical protein [Vibrio sp.]
MAKSRLAASRNKNKLIAQPKVKDNVTALGLSFELHQRGVAFSNKYSLRDWCHESCDPQRPLAEPSRLKKMQKLKKWVDQEKINQTSESSIRSKLSALKQYIIFCDVKQLNPFSQVGYLAYAGNAGELWRLVGAANEPKSYSFQYHDGEEVGLLESSASLKKIYIDLMLSVLDFDVSEWSATMKTFSSKNFDSSIRPYEVSEWYTLVERTQLFFFSLAAQLIAFKEDSPEAPLPQYLEDILVDQAYGRDVRIKVGGRGIKDGAGSPFNQCMAAAYTLFAYYTAFNDTVIQEVRHPIKVVTSKAEGRTSKISQVRAYKGRASKDVKALFTSLEENLHSEASDKEAGFIVADINKRDTIGVIDGITFLQTLEMLSKSYSNDPYDTLIYFLDNQGDKTQVHVSVALQHLSQNLNLLSNFRGDLTDHLVKTYTDIVEHQKMTVFNWTRREDSVWVMNKQVIEIDKMARTKRANRIAYAALSCMTDVSLRNALIPLSYSEKNCDGDITVSFKYLDGSKGEFTVAAKYRPFLQLVERYAATRNPLPKEHSYGFCRAKKPPFSSAFW